MTRTIRLSLILSVLALVALVALLALWEFDSGQHPDCLGTAEFWSPGGPFPPRVQAEVLETGLEDVRGLAADLQGNVFLAEANGHVLEYHPAARFGKRSSRDVQPEKIDMRGMDRYGESFLVAEHSRSRIAVWPQGKRTQKVMDTAGMITGPSGISLVGDTMFVTDDRPWPGTGSEPGLENSDYGRWMDKGSPRLFGSVWVCPLVDGKCAPAPVTTRLRHPSGIVAESANGPLYVVESDAREVRWPIFEKQNEKWVQTGALGSVAAAAELPPFLGIALHDSHRFIFAAGPNSLYVFAKEGHALGRIKFEEQVTGVTCNTQAVYLIVGHKLCRIAWGARDKEPVCAAPR